MLVVFLAPACLHSQLAGDIGCDVVLESGNVGGLAVVLFPPDLRAIAHIRWLSAETNYGLERNTQEYFSDAGQSRVQSDVHGVTADVVVNLPLHICTSEKNLISIASRHASFGLSVVIPVRLQGDAPFGSSFPSGRFSVTRVGSP